MKRLIIILSVFLTISITSLIIPQGVFADHVPCNPSTGENCYFCEYLIGSGCFPREAFLGSIWYHCIDGDVPDDAVCHLYDSDESTCNGLFSLSCITPAIPSTKCNPPNFCVSSDGCPAGSEVAGDCKPATWVCCESCAYCDDITNICHNAPIGTPLCEFGNIDECQASGCGFTAPKYTCIDNRCIEGDTGQYASAGECRLDGCESALGGFIIKIFCDKDGNPTTEPDTGEIYTAIGCIPVISNPKFTEFLIKWGVGIGGLIAFLLIVYSGFLVMTSAGDPKKLAAGKQLITAAISGLILLITGAFLLRLFGVDILGIF